MGPGYFGKMDRKCVGDPVEPQCVNASDTRKIRDPELTAFALSRGIETRSVALVFRAPTPQMGRFGAQALTSEEQKERARVMSEARVLMREVLGCEGNASQGMRVEVTPEQLRRLLISDLVAEIVPSATLQSRAPVGSGGAGGIFASWR